MTMPESGRESPVLHDVEKEPIEEPSPSDKETSGNTLTKTDTQRSIADSFTPLHEFAFILIICLQQFFTQSSVGGPIAILNPISETFNLTNPGERSWTIASFSLTAGTFLLPGGRFGDVFGYKLMLIVGLSWYSLWSLVCGLSVYSGHVLFDFARTLQGIGPAIMLPNALAILGATYAPGKKKAMYFALFGAMAPNGSVIGSAFASLFALAWWPWFFWAMALAMAALAAASVFVIPAPPRKVSLEHLTLSQTLRKLDLEGSFLGIAALVLINFAWNQSGVVGWQQAYVYVTLILGFLFLPAFFWWEIRCAEEPLIPFHAFTNDVSFVLACEACGWACFGIWVYYTWQFLENLRGATPLLATAYLTPVCISGFVAAIATGFLLGRLHPGWVMLMSMCAFVVGTVLIAVAPVRQTYWANVFVMTIITPFGMDMSFPAGTLILSNSVGKKHQGIASGLVTTVVNYSVSLGLGFAGTVEGQVANGNLLKGYRGALYMGLGFAGLGTAVAVLYVVKTYADRGLQKRREQQSSE